MKKWSMVNGQLSIICYFDFVEDKMHLGIKNKC